MANKRPPLTISELQAFVQVGQSRSFRSAADNSFISQPALSRRIQSAESKLDIKLFDRNTRRVELTASGRELLPIAHRIVNQFNDSLVEFSEYMSGCKGHITIASLPSFAAIILPGIIAGFRQTNPDVTIALKPVDATSTQEWVKTGNADFGIAGPPATGSGLKYESFVLSDELVIICARHDPLAQERQVEWSIFAHRPYITSGTDSSITPVVERALEAHGILARAQYEAANISVLGALVAEGLGIAAIPRRSLHLVDTRRLHVVPLAGAPFNREVGILTLKGRTATLPAKRFLEILIRRLEEWNDDVGT